jgi:hypothetical protein
MGRNQAALGATFLTSHAASLNHEPQYAQQVFRDLDVSLVAGLMESYEDLVGQALLVARLPWMSGAGRLIGHCRFSPAYASRSTRTRSRLPRVRAVGVPIGATVAVVRIDLQSTNLGLNVCGELGHNLGGFRVCRLNDHRPPMRGPFTELVDFRRWNHP